MRSLPLLVLSATWHPCPILSQPTNPISSSFGAPGDTSFDYIIIGAGTSGLAIAASLAADPSLSVAVVEAGGFYEVDDGNISVIPGDCTFYSGTAPNNTQPLVDWGFDTVPQAVCFSLRGKMFYAFVDNGTLKGRKQPDYALCPWQDLGGSSSRNYMVYHRRAKSCPLLLSPSADHTRPTTESLAQWATEVGDSAYTFSNLLPFYKSGIHYTPANLTLYTNSTVLQDPSAFAGSSEPLRTYI